PDLVPVAQEVFDRLMPEPNQLQRLREDVRIGQKELLEVHDGTRTEAGMRLNIRVGIQYIEAWLRGRGAVPLYNLMEDAATAEISRAQVWQWIHHRIPLSPGGAVVTAELVRQRADKTLDELSAAGYEPELLVRARGVFELVALAEDFPTFLTLPAYELIP
ncbi:MAG: malate synthase A, partial [Acidobacteriota bacterium]|nr:malate synthase A [Acidobacteriota bacterium]